VGEIEAELRGAGTDAAVLAAGRRGGGRGGAAGRAAAPAAAAASAGWERLAAERGAAADALQQARGGAPRARG